MKKCVDCLTYHLDVDMVRCPLDGEPLCLVCCARCPRYCYCEVQHTPEEQAKMRQRAATFDALLAAEETED